MSVAVDARDALARRVARRGWTFSATPPRGNYAGRQDTRLVPIRIRVTDGQALFYVQGRQVGRTNRADLLTWLTSDGPRASYLDLPLTLRYSSPSIVWFELGGHTAPTVLTPPAVEAIIRVLQT